MHVVKTAQVSWVKKSQLELGGFYIFLEGILHTILIRNIMYRGILSSYITLSLNPIEPFGNSLHRGHGLKIFS